MTRAHSHARTQANTLHPYTHSHMYAISLGPLTQTHVHVRHQFGPSHTDTCTCTPSVWALSHSHMYMCAISLGPLKLSLSIAYHRTRLKLCACITYVQHAEKMRRALLRREGLSARDLKPEWIAAVVIFVSNPWKTAKACVALHGASRQAGIFGFITLQSKVRHPRWHRMTATPCGIGDISHSMEHPLCVCVCVVCSV